MSSRAFDRAYFSRFYFNPATRIADSRYFDRLAAFAGAYLTLLGCPVKRILDVGCGPGFMHDGLRRAWPRVRIDGMDVSSYACEKYGWRLQAIEDLDVVDTYDLVICHDVLQYLDNKAAERALRKLTALSKSALFFSVLTREDWAENCDQRLTDSDAYLRTAAWYRRRLAASFRNAGGGIYIKRDTDIVLYALEHS